MLVAPGCGSGHVERPDCRSPIRCAPIAERYVKLVLAVGQHDADYVDAFYGPAEWRKEAEARRRRSRRSMRRPPPSKPTSRPSTPRRCIRRRRQGRSAELWGLRRQYLARQLAAMRARIGMLQGKKLTFDEESLALYDAVAPVKPESEFEAVLKQLEARLPGEGSLIERYDRYKQGVRDPQGARRSRVPGSDSRLPPADRASSICRPRKASGSSTSPANRGAATTGIRATSGA